MAEIIQNTWYRIPGLKNPKRFYQAKILTCQECGCHMYFIRQSGVDYHVHNPFHYSSPLCRQCLKRFAKGLPLGFPGGGVKNLTAIEERIRKSGQQLKFNDPLYTFNKEHLTLEVK